MGNTPLHEAAIWGHSEVVEYIKQNLTEKNPKNNKGQTPANLAGNNEKSSFVDFLTGQKLGRELVCYDCICLKIRVDKARTCGYWHSVKRKKHKKQGETEINHWSKILDDKWIL